MILVQNQMISFNDRTARDFAIYLLPACAKVTDIGCSFNIADRRRFPEQRADT
jgi:hypothetical protein